MLAGSQARLAYVADARIRSRAGRGRAWPGARRASKEVLLVGGDLFASLTVSTIDIIWPTDLSCTDTSLPIGTGRTVTLQSSAEMTSVRNCLGLFCLTPL